MLIPRFAPVGERAVLVEFGQEISPRLQAQVTALDQALAKAKHPAISEWVPTYRSVLVYYDPLQLAYGQLVEWLKTQLAEQAATQTVLRRQVTIPVFYGGKMGPDLAFVAEHCQLSEAEVIRRHQAPAYLVYMLGFMPGFPYLGGLDPRLVTPRLATPRTVVPAGSVGIADQQTGVYPLQSPGGWQLIGRTPLKLYQPEQAEPFLLRPGDLLRFQAITGEQYAEIEQQVASGSYIPEIKEGVSDEQR